MAIHITRPDVLWLEKLLDMVQYIHKEYPELFSEEEEETIKIVAQLIRSLK